MRRLPGKWVMLGCVLTLSWSSLAGVPIDKEWQRSLEVTVRVYNYAQVPSMTLTRAERDAAWVLKQIGVEIEWINYHVSMVDDPGAVIPRESIGPTDLVLRVMSRSMADRAPFTKAALAAALHDESGHISYISDIFYHRVEELAGEHHVPPRLILGHIAAHEIGHLLLGPLGHSREGIMQSPWGKDDLEHASRGRLLFTPKQGERIRAEVLARTMKQDSLQLARSKVPGQRTLEREAKGPVQTGERGKPVVVSIPR